MRGLPSKAETRALIRFARATLAEEACQQGWKDPCKRPAAYEHAEQEYLMCGLCKRSWFDCKYDEDDKYEREWIKEGIADGSMRRLKSGDLVKRHPARRRDDPHAINRLNTETVRALLMLERLAAE